MGYCFMSTQKIKTMGSLASKYNHNYRKVEVANADPDLADCNQELVSLAGPDGRELDYNEAWKERVKDLDWAERGPRKNAVLAIEVVTTFSREENLDLEAWKQQNVEWLQKTFNVAPDGKSNVLSVMYHADEPGNVHCHAIIIPVDERGNLNASRFLDGRQKLTEMQNSYAKDMESFGLERGLENGQARHQDIKKYYADLNNAIQVSEPEPQETALDYRDRVLEELQTAQAAAMRERREKERQMERRLAERRIAQEKELKSEREALQREKKEAAEALKKEYASLIQELRKGKQEYREQAGELAELHARILEKRQELETLKGNLDDANTLSAKAAFYDEFQKQYALLEQMDPQRAERFRQDLSYMSTLSERSR